MFLQSKTTRQLGHSIESLACDYLQKRKLSLVEKNFNCRLGEIDLIMLDKDCLVFVEVRYRKSSLYGSGAESIGYSKQQKIINTAELFLQRFKRFANLPCRFDVVTVSGQTSNLKFQWIPNAFQVEY